MSRRTVGVLLVVVSAASFGAMAIFARLAYAGGADVTAVLFLRFVIAAACMTVLLHVRGLAWPRGRVLGGLVLMGGLGYVGQSLSYFTALTMASVSLVALLLYAYPAIVTVLSVLLFGHRLTAAKAVALLLALAGAALTIGPELDGRPLGIALGLLAAVIYSIYIITGGQLTPRAGALPAAAVIMTAAAGVFAVLALLQRPAFPGTPGSWAAVAAIAVISTVVAITAFFAGLARLGAPDASTLSTIEPAVTVVLAAVVLGERVAGVQLLGGAMILGAVVLLARTPPVRPPGAARPVARYRSPHAGSE